VGAKDWKGEWEVHPKLVVTFDMIGENPLRFDDYGENLDFDKELQ